MSHISLDNLLVVVPRPSIAIIVIFSIIAFTVACTSYLRKRRYPAPLPPGPRGDPILGHVRVVPMERPELSYAKWAKEYKSDLICVHFLGQLVVILNTAKSAVDLMDKRGPIYSSRPKIPFFEEQGWRETLPFIPLGPLFRKHRKMIKNALSPMVAATYHDVQELQAHRLVVRLSQTPESWLRHVGWFATAIILTVTYGFDITRDDDPYITLAEGVSDALASGGTPGATMVDVFPIIRYLPRWVTFIKSLKIAREGQATIKAMREVPFEAVQRSMENGTARPSFLRTQLELLAAGNELGVTHADIKGAAGTMYVGGQDTIWSTITVFVLAMTVYPDVQKKAQAEIDRVVGNDRIISFTDRSSLPFLERLMQETFRWSPVAPLGAPHLTVEDDIYNGMFIPKGKHCTYVLANAVAITHDEDIYSDPDVFNPDRYLPVEEGGLGEPLPVSQFGFGRRICPGRDLASATVWIALASILQAFRIKKAIGLDSKEITPNPVIHTGITNHLEPFPTVLVPRSQELIEKVAKAV